MKTTIILKIAIGVFTSQLFCDVQAQGTFIYDQQSSTESLAGEGSVNVGANQPIGQSFTPGLSEVGFIRLRVLSFLSGGTLILNLRENSITGNVLGASSPFPISGGFIGYTNFFFPAPVAVNPGTTYYFQPFLQSGSGIFVGSCNCFGYAGGEAFFNGAPVPGHDLWFREGLYVPEPSALALIGFSIPCFIFRRHNPTR